MFWFKMIEYLLASGDKLNPSLLGTLEPYYSWYSPAGDPYGQILRAFSGDEFATAYWMIGTGGDLAYKERGNRL